MTNKIRCLIECIRTLGWGMGWKYWSLQNKAKKDPGIAIRWANNCDDEADQLEARGDYRMAWCLRDWADKLRLQTVSYQLDQLQAKQIKTNEKKKAGI